MTGWRGDPLLIRGLSMCKACLPKIQIYAVTI